MTYDRAVLFENAKTAISDNEEIVFVDDIACEIGISRSLFYNIFPANSEEIQTLKDLLTDNKVRAKRKLRKKWFNTDNATLSLCAYKLLADDNELKLLSNRPNDSNTEALSETITTLFTSFTKDKQFYDTQI